MAGALIGRHAEVQQVVEALKVARGGQATTIVVRGEPGIGKSRVLAEALSQAELLGHTVLSARLDELDRLVPYAAFGSALGRALEKERDLELCLVARDVTATLTGGDPSAGLTLPLLASALERLLRTWGNREPVVLAVDDLHAADSDTLTVLSLLIRRLQGDRITFLATTRVHPPDVSVALASTVERLGHDGLALLIDLGPLDADDVRAIVRGELDASPDERLVELLWHSTRGNPFYVEEGLRSLQASGSVIVDDGRGRLVTEAPPSVLRSQSTIVYRLFNLGPSARAVARSLTAFRRFVIDDLGVLAELSGLEPTEVEDAFDTLVNARIVVRDEEGYEFAHPIVRHTLYEDVGPAERRRMHAAIAARLSTARDQGRAVVLTDLATHVSSSASPGDERAVGVLMDAAEASATAAPASAAAWYERALDLLGANDDRRGAVLADRAKALFLASQLDAASEAATEALTRLPGGHLRARTSALQITTLTSLGRLEEALALSDALLAAAGEPVPRLHAERGSLLVHLDRFQEAEAEAERALALAGDDAGARALGYRAVSIVAHERGDVAGCLEAYERQLEATAPLGPAARLSALTTHAMHLSIMGFVPEASALLEEALELRDALGGAALQDALDVVATLNDWHAGRWDPALDRLRWLAIPPAPAEAWMVLAHAAELAILAARSEVGEARTLAAALEHAPIASGTARWARAVFHVSLGDFDTAAALVEEGWKANEASGRRADLANLLGVRVELELERGDTDAARHWAEVLADACRELTAPSARSIRDRCVAAAGLDPGRAVTALEVADAHGLVVEAAHAHVVLAALGNDVESHLRAAFDTYRDLGAETWRRRTARAMKDAGIEPPRAARVASGALTDTEVKLAQLVHDGLTNREIANVLIISPKTVEVYLSRVFAKTGCESRVELAVAFSKGLVAAPSLPE